MDVRTVVSLEVVDEVALVDSVVDCTGSSVSSVLSGGIVVVCDFSAVVSSSVVIFIVLKI